MIFVAVTEELSKGKRMGSQKCRNAFQNCHTIFTLKSSQNTTLQLVYMCGSRHQHTHTHAPIHPHVRTLRIPYKYFTYLLAITNLFLINDPFSPSSNLTFCRFFSPYYYWSSPQNLPFPKHARTRTCMYTFLSSEMMPLNTFISCLKIKMLHFACGGRFFENPLPLFLQTTSVSETVCSVLNSYVHVMREMEWNRKQGCGCYFCCCCFHDDRYDLGVIMSK